MTIGGCQTRASPVQAALAQLVMREMADAMVASGLKQKGYEFINLSEGWPMGPNERFSV